MSGRKNACNHYMLSCCPCAHTHIHARPLKSAVSHPYKSSQQQHMHTHSLIGHKTALLDCHCTKRTQHIQARSSFWCHCMILPNRILLHFRRMNPEPKNTHKMCYILILQLDRPVDAFWSVNECKQFFIVPASPRLMSLCVFFM